MLTKNKIIFLILVKVTYDKPEAIIIIHSEIVNVFLNKIRSKGKMFAFTISIQFCIANIENFTQFKAMKINKRQKSVKQNEFYIPI